jgi:Tfp pilus assembly protein PilO
VNQKTRNPKVVAGAAVAVGLVLAAAGWLLLVSPKRSEASKLQTEISSVQSEIAVRRSALARKPKISVDVRSSDLFRLTKAVPDRTDMSGIMLELSRQAQRSGVTFEAITPSSTVEALGYQVQPLAVVVNGRFGQIGEFMNRLRKLVTVRKSHLDAGGRLFAVDNVELIEPETPAKFPVVKATVTLDAFVYAGGAPSEADGTTPSDTTTPPTPSGAVAAGATP